VTVGGVDMTSIAANYSVIDSGTSLFYLNSELFDNVISTFFGACNSSICPCGLTTWPTFDFTFNGVEVSINQSSYMSKNDILDSCTYNFGSLSNLSTGTMANQLLLGDTLFRNYIITFDKPNAQVGFSQGIISLSSV
jgi:hypothetical protein